MWTTLSCIQINLCDLENYSHGYSDVILFLDTIICLPMYTYKYETTVP